MTLTKNSILAAVAALLVSVIGQSVRADYRIPADNTTTISKSGEVQLMLDTLTGQANQTLAGATITMVDRNGVARKFKADDNGIVRIHNAEAGTYSVVASSKNAYGSTLLVVRPSSDNLENAQPARMTLATVDSDKLNPWMNKFVKQFSSSSNLRLTNAIDGIQASDDAFGYRIALRNGGTLDGKLVSVLDAQASGLSLEGTEVVLMQKGVTVGKTYTNASGEFQFKGVRAGAHGIVAAGPAGYASLAFEAVRSIRLSNEV